MARTLNTLGSKCGWHGTIQDFLSEDVTVWGKALTSRLRYIGLSVELAQKRAWWDCYKKMVEILPSLVSTNPHFKGWHIIFEYELMREKGRRPDVLIISELQILVLEFKQSDTISLSYLDQVQAYARDIKNYHSLSHALIVLPILVLSNRTQLRANAGEVYIVSPDQLPSLIREISGVDEKGYPDICLWLQADYAPLPSLITAARDLFHNKPLPKIKTIEEAGISQAITTINRVAYEAKRTNTHHLILVTGVPGAGKTLVGLQFVYQNQDKMIDEEPAIFLSGNRSLVSVLQDALDSKVFVREVLDYLGEYGNNWGNLPQESIVVFDEAQRAWDRKRVLEKRHVNMSEPEQFLKIGARKAWFVVIGLIGTGQEIYLGEESGLSQWNEAIRASNKEWVVHCPFQVVPNFSAQLHTHPTNDLQLAATIRSHTAHDVHAWAENVLVGDNLNAARLAEKLVMEGFKIYISQDSKPISDYIKTRYEGEIDKRFGLIVSSLATNTTLSKFNNRIQKSNIAAWFNNDPRSIHSCCQLSTAATEFECQGLELDFPIITWGNDLVWNGKWDSSNAMESKALDPHALRLNTYRVLLTRGRDGIGIIVSGDSSMGKTFEFLLSCGAKQININN